MQEIEQMLDSIEVAGMVEKEHKLLMRDIRRYIEQLYECKLEPVDFFIKSSYVDTKGETRPCYYITRKGCDLIANKLTGTKGTIFTARYINRFHEMESLLCEQKPAVAPVQPEQVAQIEKEYADLKKEIREIKSDLKRIGQSGGLQTVTCLGYGRYKDWIIRMLNVINESEDELFLRQMYTLFKKHLERKNNFQWMA